MKGDPCADRENVVRAVTGQRFDKTTGKIGSDIFKGPNCSVSRLDIFPLERQWTILGGLGRELHLLLELNVGEAKRLGHDYSPPVVIHILEDPTENNPAHAEIIEKLPDGLAKRLRDGATRHFPITK